MAVDPPKEEVVADDLDALFEEILSEEPATTSLSETIDFRIEINCQKGNHYMRTRRGSGRGRRKENGVDGKETYRYDGSADIVAGERQGYYGARWAEYQSNHTCHYKDAKTDQATAVGDSWIEDGIRSLA